MSHHLDLAALGLDGLKRVYWNLSAPALVEEAIKRDEGALAEHGPLIVRTGTHTGRSPNDKFTVKEATSSDKIWWGKVNIPFEEKKFDALFNRVKTYLKGKEVFVQDCFAGADPEFQVPIRVVTEFAWQNLFAQNLFIRSEGLSEKNEKPFTVISVPGLQAIPTQDGTASETFIIANLERRIVLIGGSRYAGEIKKSIFFVLNYLLPLKGVLSMHCSANIGKENDVAVFFGLSGTGKTTLSADPERKLIGDDEHGWSEHGVFNFEGGCYAKMIKLNPEAEPEIFSTTRKFGTVLENVGYDVDSRALDLNDDTLTENTRAAYPLTHLSNIEPSGMGGHPRNIIMLTADAFGVMPPIAKLTPEQAMYHFLSGYTAKVAGTERGIKEPQATFSTCFGAPFMALHPTVYAKMLGEKIEKHETTCWLVNTGWSGGPYGVGSRFKIAYTRALLRAALNGSLEKGQFVKDPVFGIDVPTQCEGVPDEILNPRKTWKDGKAYDEMAEKLASLFHSNIEQFAGQVPEEILAAGPKKSALTAK